MPLHHSIPIIDGLFNLTYCAIPARHSASSPAAMKLFVCPSSFWFPSSHRLYHRHAERLREQETGLITALAFILGGAVGNLIDRALLWRSDRFFGFLLVELSLAGLQSRRQFHHHRRGDYDFLFDESERRRSFRPA